MRADILDREVKISILVQIEQRFELGTKVFADQTYMDLEKSINTLLNEVDFRVRKELKKPGPK